MRVRDSSFTGLFLACSGRPLYRSEKIRYVACNEEVQERDGIKSRER
jgi:hypothetical protein